MFVDNNKFVLLSVRNLKKYGSALTICYGLCQQNFWRLSKNSTSLSCIIFFLVSDIVRALHLLSDYTILVFMKTARMHRPLGGVLHRPCNISFLFHYHVSFILDYFKGLSNISSIPYPFVIKNSPADSFENV